MIRFGHRFGAAVAGLVAFAGLESSAMAQTATPPLKPFTINTGSTYSDGANPFSSEYWRLQTVSSPHYGSPTAAGKFVFLPKTTNSSGGLMQIVFRDLSVPLQLKCQVGSNMDFKVTVSQLAGGSKTFTKASAPLPGRIEPYLVFDMDDIKTPVTTIVTIESDRVAAENQTWNLIECLVAQRP